MQSSGGVLPIADSAEHAAWTVMSGPAGGVIGAARLAADEGARLALTFDMGGTSCDVALVRDGAPARTGATVIAGHPLHLPMLDVATVSAGGGSIAWADSGGALRVGTALGRRPPGPAAYGLGGEQPTVTDADVVLGRLPADRPSVGGSAWTRTPPGRLVGGWPRPRPGRGGVRGGHHDGRRAGDGARAAARERGARRGPARGDPDRLRRGRARSTPARWPTSSASGACSRRPRPGCSPRWGW